MLLANAMTFLNDGAGRVLRKARILTSSANNLFLQTRREVGFPPYHELKLPLRTVERILCEAGAENWFIWSIRNRSRRGEIISAMEWIARNVDRRTTIFETGCGCSANLIWLGQHGFTKLSGSDVSTEAVAAGNQLSRLSGVPIAIGEDNCLAPRLPVSQAGLVLALAWTYLSAEFELGRFLVAYRDKLEYGGIVIFDMVDATFDQMKDNQYRTDDWSLPVECRRPTQYKIRMTVDEVKTIAVRSGFEILAILPGTEMPPRFVTVVKRRD
jgi:hypothetical protein